MSAQASVLDVAKYILDTTGPMTTMKLQKLCFYSQAWYAHFTKSDELFPEQFQAWANGPVCRRLFDAHRGSFMIDAQSAQFGDTSKVDDGARKIIDEVLQAYGSLSGADLSRMTHSESPWIEARGDLPATALSTAVISIDSMRKFCQQVVATA